MTKINYQLNQIQFVPFFYKIWDKTNIKIKPQSIHNQIEEKIISLKKECILFITDFIEFGTDKYVKNYYCDKKKMNIQMFENHSGKTAIMDAIKLVLKTNAYERIRIDKSDFHSNTEKNLEFRFILKD